jgi:hypothetical protein
VPDDEHRDDHHEDAATTLTLRWDEQHVTLIKRAAAVLGVPLSYAKQVLVRQAVADLELDEKL